VLRPEKRVILRVADKLVKESDQLGSVLV